MIGSDQTSGVQVYTISLDFYIAIRLVGMVFSPYQ